MATERWQRAKELFAAAIELTDEERPAFLNRECAGDPELECEVRLLLEHHAQPHELLVSASLALDSRLHEVLVQPLSEGKRVGKYSVFRELGRGGMGEVYLAEDTVLHRKVALKILSPRFSLDEHAVKRFEREAMAASSLNHPNVPIVYDAGESGGRRYIATEYVEGMTLAQRIANGRLEWRQAVAIARVVGRALSAAHDAGIIHRDVKPANILLREDGAIKLADFGIAKLLERSEAAAVSGRVTTGAGAIIGTPAYMSPEQACGQPVDARTDTWSLAAVLHEMILGQPPVERRSQLRRSRLAPPSISKIVNRALERDREQRYSTTAEFVNALESASKPWPFQGKTAGWAAISALLLAGAYVVPRARREPATADLFRVAQISKLTTRGNAADVAVSADGRYVLYVVNEAERYSIRLRELGTGADVERIAASDAIYSDLTFTPDSSFFYYLRDDHKDERTLFKAPLMEGPPRKVMEDVDSPAAISPDGREIEFARGNPSKDETALFVASADGAGARQIAVRPYERRFLFGGATWSPDGKRILTAALESPEEAVLVEVPVSNGRERRIGISRWRWIGRVNLISGGRGLAFPAAETGSVHSQLYQITLGENRLSSITRDLASYNKVSASANSIAAIQEDRLSAIWITHLDDTSYSRRITPPAGRYWQLAWQSDGSLLSQTGMGSELNIWQFFQNGSRRQISSGPYIDWNAVVSGDGRRLAFISNRAGGFHLWTCDAQGHFLRQLTTGQGEDASPSFMPDGAIVYSEEASGTSSVFKISPDGGAPIRMLATPARNPVVSPNGQYIMCELNERGERWQTAMLETGTARVIRRFPDIPDNSWLRWTADSKALAYIATQNGVSNILIKPLAGGKERSVTGFRDDIVFSFDIARGGREIASVRGIPVSDVVVLERAR